MWPGCRWAPWSASSWAGGRRSGRSRPARRSRWAGGGARGGGVVRTVREGSAGAPSSGLAAELVVFRRGRMWLALLTTVLYQSAAVGLLSYVSPLLIEVSGVRAGWVPVVLLGFGVGSVVGVVTGGRLADRFPWWTLFGSLGAAVAVLAVVALLAPVAVVTVSAVVLLGVVAFVVAAPLNARVFALAGAASTLASASTTVAFNLGNTIGPALGGAAIDAGFGYTAPAWLGTLLVGGAIVVGLVSRTLDVGDARRRAPTARSTP